MNTWKRGILTIELSLLMPLILGIILSVIMLTFVMHDRCVIECILRETVMSLSDEADVEMSEAIIEKSIDTLRQKTILNWEIEPVFYHDEDIITLYVEGHMLRGLFGMDFLSETEVYTYEFGCEAYRINEYEYLREHREYTDV